MSPLGEGGMLNAQMLTGLVVPVFSNRGDWPLMFGICPRNKAHMCAYFLERMYKRIEIACELQSTEILRPKEALKSEGHKDKPLNH